MQLFDIIARVIIYGGGVLTIWSIVHTFREAINGRR